MGYSWPIVKTDDMTSLADHTPSWGDLILKLWKYAQMFTAS